ncbi:MAG: hypothetical protein L6262_08335 [Weeksellaceae bacterium]|nr:hypothetical protein [Weeksellaceae bacterium]
MKLEKFNIGILLIILSFIASVISFYLLIFTIPVFLIGCICIIKSKEKIILKVLSILIPLIVYFPATFLFLSLYNYTNPKEFLIPENYAGPLRIIYEEDCGQKLIKENGSEIFKFPKNGIIILSSEFDGGINHKYFFIDKAGNKKQIPEANIDGQNLKFPNVSIQGAGTMSNGEVKIGVNSSDDKDNIKYSEFYVNRNSVDDFDYKKQQIFDSLTIAIVNECRKR